MERERIPWVNLAFSLYIVNVVWTFSICLTNFPETLQTRPMWVALSCLILPIIVTLSMGIILGLKIQDDVNESRSCRNIPVRRSYGAVDGESWPIAASGNAEKE